MPSSRTTTSGRCWLDHARKLGGALGFPDDVEALALEDEAKEPSLCRSTLADDDPYPVVPMFLPSCPPSVPHEPGPASALWGYSCRKE